MDDEGSGRRTFLTTLLAVTCGLAGVGVGYALWGLQVDDLKRDVVKLEGWIAEEMRGSDDRHRVNETKVRELQAELKKLQGALAEAQADWRAERQRRHQIEERLATQELRRGGR